MIYNKEQIIKIIKEEYLKLNEYLTSDGISLLKYFSLPRKTHISYLPDSYNEEWMFNEFMSDRNYNPEDIATSKDVDGEPIIDDYFDVNNLSKEIWDEYAEWLYSALERNDLEIPPSEQPAWMFFGEPTLIKNQWLIHFTDDANPIANEGFKYGVNEIDKLGLTTHLGEFEKKYGGYNFAYTLNDYLKYAKNRHGYKYGKEAVIFTASGIKMWHYTDEEYQVIFYGNTARNIIPITSGENASYGVYSKKNGQLLFENDDIDKIVNWVVTNFRQYQKQLL